MTMVIESDIIMVDEGVIPIETGSYIPAARGNYTCMVDVNICI